METPEQINKACPHFGSCGGCSYLDMPYDKELKMKEEKVKGLIDSVLHENDGEYSWEGIKPSPAVYGYRNKMEFSFGDEIKGGPLTLGLHKKRSFHDILDADGCLIADEDFSAILKAVREYCVENGWKFYNKMSHQGYMRHLLIRKAAHTGEILTAFVTSSQMQPDLSSLTERLCGLKLKGKLTGFLHISNDSVSDAIKADSIEVLYGRDYFDETLLGLHFRITPFSFFQTNSLGAEQLYSTAQQYIADIQPDGRYLRGKTVYDLYSGTGTIAQLMAAVADRVIGVEIVGEAVEAARKNAEDNGLTNCTFVAGDVMKVLDEIAERPDFIIVDPPRNGISPKALEHIISYGVQYILYISCKPESLSRDLEMLTGKGYIAVRACCFDNFPWTENVESMMLLSKR